MLNQTLCFIALLMGLTACTGTLDTSDIRRGNYQAPDDLKVSESCNSDGEGDPNCRVVISHPPAPNSDGGEK